MSDQATPAAATTPPKDKRLSVRVASDQLQWWRYIAVKLDGQSLSDMIRDTVNQYVAKVEQAPAFDDRAGPFSGIAANLSGFVGAEIKRPKRPKRSRPRIDPPCDSAIVLRLPAAELKRWTIAAARDGCSVSVMIRQQVTRHVQTRIDFYTSLIREQKEDD